MSQTAQVQQRGIEATANIIQQLLAGMNVREGQPCLIVDMLPSRWGCPNNVENNCQPNMFFLVTYCAESR